IFILFHHAFIPPTFPPRSYYTTTPFRLHPHHPDPPSPHHPHHPASTLSTPPTLPPPLSPQKSIVPAPSSLILLDSVRRTALHASSLCQVHPSSHSGLIVLLELATHLYRYSSDKPCGLYATLHSHNLLVPTPALLPPPTIPFPLLSPFPPSPTTPQPFLSSLPPLPTHSLTLPSASPPTHSPPSSDLLPSTQPSPTHQSPPLPYLRPPTYSLLHLPIPLPLSLPPPSHPPLLSPSLHPHIPPPTPFPYHLSLSCPSPNHPLPTMTPPVHPQPSLPSLPSSPPSHPPPGHDQGDEPPGLIIDASTPPPAPPRYVLRTTARPWSSPTRRPRHLQAENGGIVMVSFYNEVPDVCQREPGDQGRHPAYSLVATYNTP
ncbi:hypothetical protein C7M84_004327, partial [Penaeus vannamei]